MTDTQFKHSTVKSIQNLLFSPSYRRSVTVLTVSTVNCLEGQGSRVHFPPEVYIFSSPKFPDRVWSPLRLWRAFHRVTLSSHRMGGAIPPLHRTPYGMHKEIWTWIKRIQPEDVCTFMINGVERTDHISWIYKPLFHSLNAFKLLLFLKWL